MLSLAILIVLHEGGHFLAAKLFGIRVEKFFLFFDYKFHIISTHDKWVQRIFPAVKNWETEYGIGWIPLGGYVKIAGMIDESMDTEQLQQPVQPWEFRARRPWQRLIVMLGGVIVNFLLAMVIYAGVCWAWGTDTIPMDKNFHDGFYFNQSAREMGFEHRDRLLRIDTAAIANYNPAQLMLDIADAKSVTVLRGSEQVEITIPEDFPLLTLLNETPPFFAPIIPAVVDSIATGAPVSNVGMLPGARILAMQAIGDKHIDGQADSSLVEISTWNEFDEIMARRMDRLKDPDCTAADSALMHLIDIRFINPGDTASSIATVKLDENYKFGFVRHIPEVQYEHHDYTLLQAIPKGIKTGWQTLVDYVGQMKYLFSAEGAKSVGSFGTIGSIFPATWDWARFWSLTAFISIILAFMNVLPIPGLDGGHALFTLIEMITGYTFSEKFQERAITVGFTLIMALMALAIFNDLTKFVF